MIDLAKDDDKHFDADKVAGIVGSISNLLELEQRKCQTMLELCLAIAQRIEFDRSMVVARDTINRCAVLSFKGTDLLYPDWSFHDLRAHIAGIQAEGVKRPIAFGIMSKVGDEWVGIVRKVILHHAKPIVLRHMLCREIVR